MVVIIVKMKASNFKEANRQPRRVKPDPFWFMHYFTDVIVTPRFPQNQDIALPFKPTERQLSNWSLNVAESE